MATASGSDEWQYDELSDILSYQEHSYRASDLLGGAFSNIELEYKLVGTYESVNGKFSQVLGNVAILDCNYVHE